MTTTMRHPVATTPNDVTGKGAGWSTWERLTDAVPTDLQCAPPGSPEVIDERFPGVWASEGPVDQPSSTTGYRVWSEIEQGAGLPSVERAGGQLNPVVSVN